jgi:hypothetical protein
MSDAGLVVGAVLAMSGGQQRVGVKIDTVMDQLCTDVVQRQVHRQLRGAREYPNIGCAVRTAASNGSDAVGHNEHTVQSVDGNRERLHNAASPVSVIDAAKQANNGVLLELSQKHGRKRQRQVAILRTTLGNG